MNASGLDAAIRKIWKDNLPLTHSRLATLESALTALNAGGLSDELRTQAMHDAHKIAGSAGSFGLTELSEIARQVEVLLEAGTPPVSDLQDRVQRIRTLVDAT